MPWAPARRSRPRVVEAAVAVVGSVVVGTDMARAQPRAYCRMGCRCLGGLGYFQLLHL